MHARRRPRPRGRRRSTSSSTPSSAWPTSWPPTSGTVPTACPGWSVKDNVVHVIGTEAMLLGRPTPEVDAARRPAARPQRHRPRSTSSGSSAYRGAPDRPTCSPTCGEAIAERRVGAGRAWTRPPSTPSRSRPPAPTRYGRFMRIRVMDMWMHEQDIREVVGRPGHDERPAPRRSALDEMTGALGFVVGKRAGAPAGSQRALRADRPDRPPHRRRGRRPGPGGRRRRRATRPSPSPCRRLLFTRLCGGRGADPAAVEVTGDGDLGCGRRRQHGVHDLTRRSDQRRVTWASRRGRRRLPRAWVSPTASRRPRRRPGPGSPNRASSATPARSTASTPSSPSPHDLEVAKRAIALGAPDPYSLITHDEVVALTGIPVGGPSLTYADDDLGVRFDAEDGNRRLWSFGVHAGHAVDEDTQFDPASWFEWMVELIDDPEPVPDLGDAAVYGRRAAVRPRRGPGLLRADRRSRRLAGQAVGDGASPAGCSSGSPRATPGSADAPVGRHDDGHAHGRRRRGRPRVLVGAGPLGAGGHRPRVGHRLPRLDRRQRRPAPHRRGPRHRASAGCSGCSTATCWRSRR